ncbi:MAG: NB-ARC domain protein [Gemmataceae bacterium]|nr:NB-ARC domain protein [Gemmataceae bacterium]
MRSLFMLLGLLALLPALVWSQEKGKVEPVKVVEIKRDTPVLYDKDIEPIFVKKCLVCHSGQIKEGKLDLDSYEGLMKGGKRGKSVIPGKSADSLLYKTCGRTGAPFMPPPKEMNQQPLSPEELAVMKLWIDEGAKAPTGVRVRPKPVVSIPPPGIKSVRGLAVSPDKTLVAAGRGNEIHIYDAASGKHIRSLVDKLETPDKKPVEAAHLSIVEALAFSPDGKLLASGSFQEVKFWDPQTGAMKEKVTGFADHVVALDFSADGKYLATGGGAPSEDGELKVLDVATGKVAVDVKNGHSDTVYGVSFSPDGTKLASCGADKFVKVFEVPSGKFIKSFEGHTHHVLGVGWKADGKLLASGSADKSIKVWDYEKGEQVRTIQGHQNEITRLFFIGKTSQVVTCSGDQTVRFWNVDNGGAVRNFPGSTEYLFAVAVSPDGTVVAAGGGEGVVRLYNGANGQFIKALAPPGEEAPKK